MYATAEHAALDIARFLKGKTDENTEAVAGAAAPPAPPPLPPPPPLTPAKLAEAEAALQQAEAEGLTLMRSHYSSTGFKNVYSDRSNGHKPYLASKTRDGKVVRLGVFATPEEAALCVARWHKQQAATASHKQQAATASHKQQAAPTSTEPAQPPMSAEAAKQTAEAEGLTLQRGANQTGYKWVVHDKYHDSATPYQTKVWQGERRGGSYVTLGSFGTPEEAALC